MFTKLTKEEKDAGYDLGYKDGHEGNSRFTSWSKEGKSFLVRDEYLEGYNDGMETRKKTDGAKSASGNA